MERHVEMPSITSYGWASGIHELDDGPQIISWELLVLRGPILMWQTDVMWQAHGVSGINGSVRIMRMLFVCS